ncbi:MAG: aminoglycoside phosphotransferase family protein [Bacteroidetes bacterium]|nr:aminoglycoside phosphotransferase family protein [Bacteroidota bacterium]MDA1268863.1 aminoglycoside phosphotransferase family protein [Bacteroidota bacterium]
MFDVLATALIQAYPQFANAPLTLSPFGEGLIHETLAAGQLDKKWILQGFNNSVFRFPNRIDHNLGLLSRHAANHPLPFQLPLPLLNRNGSGLTAIQGKNYRLFDFVDGSTLQQVQQPAQAGMAAQAYGKFASWSHRLPAEAFEETIPNFHRLDLRFARLVEVAKQLPTIPEEEQALLQGYLEQLPLVSWYQEQRNHLPLRITHNDTKINNLIFSKTLNQVEAVVDLDTVMGGYLMYDFGDLVRTVACSLPETSTDWKKIQALPELFEELLSGYLEGLNGAITPMETESLLLGGEIMTLIMGVRFLTDHLEGNVYYRVSYPLQNLHRAKNQLALLQSQQGYRARFANFAALLQER